MSSSLDDASPSAKTLRAEIVASEKTRADFLKLKLIVVAAIASAALGLGNSSPRSSSDDQNINLKCLLCLIPFACAFCDLLCAHITLRIRVIGVYLRKKRKDGYEEFAQVCRDKWIFSLENLATWISSLLLSALVCCYPLFDQAAFNAGRQPGSHASPESWFYYCGSAGIALSIATYLAQKILARKMDKVG